MDPLMVVMRLLHIVLGAFWAGTIVFMAIFLEPSIRAAMPESGKVMLQLQRRRLMTVMPAVALLAILSGGWLMWRISGGMDPAWFRSSAGRALTYGAGAALLAFAIGVGVMRPAQLKAFALAQQLAQAGGSAPEARQTELAALRRRATVSLRWVAALLVVAVAAMAIARYL